MRSLISTAPEDIRSELRHLNVYRLLERAAAFRPGARRDLSSLTKLTLRMLARRAQALEAEVAELDAILEPLLVAAGDNPERLRNERTFAHLCGVAPIDASSGKHARHRLNRGGDRQANSALWRIVVTRMVYDDALVGDVVGAR